MKRGGPLRRTPLDRGTSQLRRTPLDRGSSKIAQRSPGQARKDRTIDQAILEAKHRDGWTCQAKARGIVAEVACLGRLEGQHVIPRGVRKDLAADPSNIVTLCMAHHQWAGETPHRGPDPRAPRSLR